VLNGTSTVENGQVVEFSCPHGYNVQGPSNLRCWHGEWAITSIPDCTAGKWNHLRCVIPVVCVTNEREESVVNQHNLFRKMLYSNNETTCFGL